MSEQNKPAELQSAIDRYLAMRKQSGVAHEHVGHVVQVFDYMVQLATDRALERLEINATIIPFPMGQNAPEAPEIA